MKKSVSFILFLGIAGFVNVFSQGTVVTDYIASDILNMKVAYTVYLPPSFGHNKTKMYPALYLLSDWDGNNTDWTNNNMALTMDTVIGNGAKEMVVIMPDGMNTYYCNNFDDRKLRYEDFIIHELIPQAESKYKIISDRQTRAIAGNSMGGYGATYLAFKFPDLFSSSYNIGGTVLCPGNEPDLVAMLKAIPVADIVNLPAYTIEVGNGDYLYNNNNIWHNQLLNKKVPHYYIVRDGLHQWDFWNECLPKAIRFVSNHFGNITNGFVSF
jgi:enterochelin esterase-like enzyme